MTPRNILSKILLFIVCALTAVSAAAMTLNPSFVDIDTTKCYRIVSAAYEKGGIGIGALHESDILVKYITEDSACTADCYWYVEREQESLRFRNKATGQYMAYSPEKDYQTFINLKLTTQPVAQTEWKLSLRDGYLVFYHSEDVDYYMGVDNATGMVKSGSGVPDHPTKCFYMVDEQGSALEVPEATPFSDYIINLAFDGQRLVYEKRRGELMFPLPTQYLDGGNYSPEVSFDAADDAQYRLVTEGASSLIFNDAARQANHTVQLLRNGTAVARGTIAFSPLPIVDMKTLILDDKVKEYRSGTLRILNQSTPDSVGVEQVLPAFFRYRGATTLNYPKRSFNIKLRDEYDEDLDTTFFRIRSKDKWIMDAMSIDQIKMRNRVSFDIWNAYSKLPYATEFDGRNGTKGQFVEVILNGAYNGIYCFTDRIDRKLLDLKKYREETADSVTIRGVLYKSNLWDNTGIHTSQLLPEASMDSVVWNNWELQYPDDYPSTDTWQPLLNLYEVCSGDELATSPEVYFYEDNLIDFHLLVMALNLIDNGNKNLFLSNKNLTKDNPYVFTPWDMDTSLGGYYDGRFSGGNYDMTPVSSLRVHKNEPFATMWDHNVGGYREKLAARWEELKQTALSVDSVQERLTAYADLFVKCGAWQREYSRWAVEEKYGCPTVQDLKAETALIVQWYQGQIQRVDQFIRDNTTAIVLPGANCVEETPLYRLDGTRTPSPAKGVVGIYVKDGKKFFISR